MTTSVPVDPHALSPAWFTDALQPQHPGVQVASVEVVGERTSTNHHVRFALSYDERAGAPDTLFAKMGALDPAHRAAVGATGMGRREARFFSELAPSIDMRIPTSYYAAADDEGAFFILLEDLKAIGCAISDGSWGISPDLAAGALADLAALHVRFEDVDRLAGVRPWVSAQPASSPERTVPTLRQVVDDHADILSDAYVAVAEMYIADPGAVVGLWAEGPETLIHGDAHIGNVFVDGDRVGFLDWGLMAVTTPMRDASYFLTMSMTAEDRRPHERDLLAHYLDVRRSLGGVDISFDEAWEAHRIHTGYTVLASFLSLVPPYNGADQRAFSDAFRNRSIDALDDLDTVSAMEARLR